jgi:hypothetical protein
VEILCQNLSERRIEYMFWWRFYVRIYLKGGLNLGLGGDFMSEFYLGGGLNIGFGGDFVRIYLREGLNIGFGGDFMSEFI